LIVRGLLLVAVLAACGDPLANGEFGGDVKLSFQAIVCGEQSSEIVPINPRLGVLWKSSDGYSLNEVTPVATEIGFPQVVEVDLFDRPPSDAELGCPILFDDLDGDEAFNEKNDPILAVSWNQLIGFEAEAYRMRQGVCDEEGLPTGQLAEIKDRPIDVSFLQKPGDLTPPETNACVMFF